jgi:hypothetical protein
MGFNISGIVINRNLENRTDELSKILDLDLDFESEIDFETASENGKDEGIIDIYYSENGTLVFAEADLCLSAYSYPDTAIFTFALFETSMTFFFAYSN